MRKEIIDAQASRRHVGRSCRIRRNWSHDEKLKLVSEAFGPGGVVVDVARRADICSSQLYRWRRLFQLEPTFVPAVVREETASQSMPCGGALVVVFPGRATVTIGADAPPALVKAALGALR